MTDQKPIPAIPGAHSIGRRINFCCISLNSTDIIRLIGVPKQLFEVIRSTISSKWGAIESEQPYHGSYEFKLRGNPWLGEIHEGVRSRSLLVALLTTMAQNGWNLIQAADTSKKVNDKDAMYFESCQPEPEPKLFGLSFNRTDRIRLIDAPEYMRVILTGAVSAHTYIQDRREYFGSYELKLSGQPWDQFGGLEGVMSRLLLCQVISSFRTLGYKLYASVDISSGSIAGSMEHLERDDYWGDLESWVFRKVSPEFWK